MSNENKDGSNNKLEMIEQPDATPSNSPDQQPSPPVTADPPAQTTKKDGEPKQQLAIPALPVSAAQAKTLLAKVCEKIPFLNKSKCIKQCLGLEETDPKARLENFIQEVNETMKTIEKLKSLDKSDQGELDFRKVEINTDNRQNTSFELTFDSKARYSFESFEYNSSKNLLMFYDKKTILLLRFNLDYSENNTTETTKYSVYEYGKLTKLPNPNTSIISARFLPQGEQIFVLFTGGFGFVNLEETYDEQKNRPHIGSFELSCSKLYPGIQYLAWMFFKTHGRILDIREFIDPYPDEIILRAAAKDLTHLTYRIQVPDFGVAEKEGYKLSIEELEIEGLPSEVRSSSIVTRSILFEEELLLANLSVQEKYLHVSFWDFTYKELDTAQEEKKTDLEEVIVAFNLADKKYNFDIDTRLLAKTQHPTNSLIFASKANDKIAQLSIDHRTGFSLKVIIELPAKVKRINSISSQDKDRFILVNVNNGQLWVYAKLNDGTYGLIYDLLLPSKYSMMAITEGLEFLLTMNDENLKAYYLQPYMKPDLYFLKMEDPPNKKKCVGSFCLNDEIAVLVRRDCIEVQNLVIGSAESFSSGFEYRNAKKVKFSRNSSEMIKGQLWMFRVTFDQELKKENRIAAKMMPELISEADPEQEDDHADDSDYDDSDDEDETHNLYNPYEQPLYQNHYDDSDSDSSDEDEDDDHEDEDEDEEQDNDGQGEAEDSEVDAAQLQPELIQDDDLDAAKQLEIQPEHLEIQKKTSQEEQPEITHQLMAKSKQEVPAESNKQPEIKRKIPQANQGSETAIKEKITRIYFAHLKPGTELPEIFGGFRLKNKDDQAYGDGDTAVVSSIVPDEKLPKKKIHQIEIYQEVKKYSDKSDLEPKVLTFPEEDFENTTLLSRGRYFAVWTDIAAQKELETDKINLDAVMQSQPAEEGVFPQLPLLAANPENTQDLINQAEPINDNHEHIEEILVNKLKVMQYLKEDAYEDNDSFNGELAGNKVQDDEILQATRPKMIKMKFYDLQTISNDTKNVTFSFYCMRGVKDIVSSKEGRYILLYGDGGYQLYVNENHKVDGKAASPSYKCIRRRWKESYQILESKFVVFSEDENYLCLAFQESCQTILLNLTDPKQIECTKLTTNTRLHLFPMLFHFITDDKFKLLAIVDYNTQADETSVRVYNLTQKCFVQSANFNQRLEPIFIDLRVFNKKELHLHIQLKDGSSAQYDTKETSLYQYINNFSDPKRLPFHEIVSHNMKNYFYQDNPALKKEYFEMMVDTFRAMNPDQIIDDTRIAILIFTLNKPEVFERVFVGQIDLNILFSLHNMLELVFCPIQNPKEHSLNTISAMLQNYVQSKKYPVIRENHVEYLIRKEPAKLTASPNSKSIFTQILFSPCHAKIVGLVKNRYYSMVEVEEKDRYVVQSTPDFFEQKVKKLLIDNPQQTNEYDIYRTRVQLELTNGSEGSLGLMSAIFEMTDDDIRYKYKQIILYKWKMVYNYSLVYCFTYYLLNILAYVYFGYNSHPAVGITIMCLNGLYILFECKCLGADWKESLKDLMNWLDFIIHGGCIFCVLAILIGFLEVLHGYLKLFAIFAISIRGITLLKMFGPMRVMVMLLGRIIYDLRFFPFLLAGVLTLAATVYKVAPLPGGNANNNITFLMALQEVFILMFMGSKADDSQVKDTSSPAGIMRSIIVVLGGTLLAQGIFNFVIAIFLQTFKKVNDDREAYELRGLILDIKDFDMFLSGFSKFRKPVKKYFYILVPNSKDGKVFENETQFDKLNSLVNGMMVEVGKKGLDKLASQAKGVIKGKDKEIDEFLDTAKANVVQTDARAKAIMGAVDNMAKDGKANVKDMAEIGMNVGDAVSPAGNAMLKEGKKIVGILQQQGERMQRGEQPDLEQMMELGISMCQQIYPESKKYIDKIKALQNAALEIVKSVKDIESKKAESITRILKATGMATSAVIDKAVGEKVANLSGLLGVLIQQAEKVKKKEALEIGKIVAEVNNSLKDVGGDFLPPKIVSLLAKLSEVASKIDEVKSGSKIDVIKAIELVADIVAETTDDEAIKKILKLLIKLAKNGDALNREFQSTGKFEIASIANCAADITDEFDPRLRDPLLKLKDLMAAVQQSAEDLKNGGSIRIAPLAQTCIKLLPKMSENTEVIVESIADMINLIENSIKDLRGSGQMDIGATIESAGGLVLKLSKQSNNTSLKDGIKKTVVAVKLIQNQMASLSKGSVNPADICASAAEVISLFAPQYADPAAKTSKAVHIIFRQVDKLKKGHDLEVESLLDDVGELATTMKADLKPVIDKFLPLVKLIAAQAQSKSFSQLGSKKASEMIESVGEIVIQIVPSAGEYLDTAKTIARFIENGNNMQQVNIGQTIETIGNLVKQFEPSVGPHVEKAAKLAGAMQQVLLLMTSSQKTDVSALFDSIGAALSEVFPQMKASIPWVKRCADVVQEAALISSKNEKASPTELIRKVGSVIVTLNRSYEASISFVLEIVDMVELQLKSMKDGKKIKVSEITSIACKIILKVEPNFSKPVKRVNEMIQFVEELITEESQHTADKLSKVVEKIGYYVCEFKPEHSSNVKKLVNIFKIVNQQTKVWLEKKEDVSIESSFRAVSRIISEVDNDLSLMVEKVRVIIDLVVTRAREFKSNKDINIQEVIDSTGEVIVAFNPQLAEEVRATSLFASAVVGMLSKGKSSAKISNIESLIAPSAEVIVVFQPDLRPAVEKTVKSIRALTDLAKSGSSDISDLKVGSFISKLSQINDLFTPEMRKYMECSAGIIAALEKLSTQIKGNKKEVNINYLIRSIANSLSLFNPKVEAVADGFIAISDSMQAQIEAVNTGESIKISTIIKSSKKIFKLLEVPNSSQYLDKTEKIVEFVEKAAADFNSQTPLEVSKMVALAEPLILEFSPSLKPQIELAKSILIVTEQQAASLLKGEVNLVKMMESTAFILDKFKPEMTPFIRSATNFALMVESKYNEVKKLPDNSSRFLVATIKSAEIVAEFKPEYREQIESVTAVLSIVDQSLQSSGNLKQVELPVIIKACSRIVEATQPRLATSIGKATDMIILLEQSIRQIIENQTSPQIVLANLLKMIELIDKGLAEKAKSILNPLNLSLAMTQGSPATFDSLAEAWKSLSEVVRIDGFDQAKIQSVLNTLKVLMSKAYELGASKTSEFTIKDATGTNYIVKSNSDGSFGSLTAQEG